MTEQRRTLYFLMPFRGFTELHAALEEAVAEAGYHAERSDADHRQGRITLKIFRGVYEADVVLVVLTGMRPNVIYELGVAHGLGKPCVLIQARQVGQEEAGNDRPEIFHFADYDTLFYDAEEPGLTTLKRELTERLRAGVQAVSPVQDALKPMIQRLRMAGFAFWGALVGGLLAFVGGLVSYLGQSLFGAAAGIANHTVGEAVLGHVTGNTLAGVALGGGSFLTYALIYNLHENLDAGARSDMKRWLLLVGQSLMALVMALVVGFYTLQFHGSLPGVDHGDAVRVAIFFGFLVLLTGPAFGLSMCVLALSPARALFRSHLRRSVLVFGLLVAGYSCVFTLTPTWTWLTSHGVFQDCRWIDPVADALGIGVWGVCMSALQWHLKWKRRM